MVFNFTNTPKFECMMNIDTPYDLNNDVVEETEANRESTVFLRCKSRERHMYSEEQNSFRDASADEERPKSEATYECTVTNFSKIGPGVFSPAFYVQNLSWRLLIMKRIAYMDDHLMDDPPNTLGIFLQCDGDGVSSTWSCFANAELKLLPQEKNVELLHRRIMYMFTPKSQEWGCSHFILWDDVLNPENGYIKNDTIKIEVHISANAPHGVGRNFKKHTEYVGLQNQGATCYINSMLQTLYFTNQLRKAVYKMPTENSDSTKSVAFALQKVFYELQFSNSPVTTEALTKSFGWEASDSFMQHDVQEFLRVLLENLENKMKGTCVDGTIPKLFKGEMLSYVKCKFVNFTSTRIETFYDIQLSITGNKNIEESFRDYVKTVTLDGDNKYNAGDHGLQEAEKGVLFASFPPVLHLHLMRFQYDPVTFDSVKFNDRFEFYEKINLDQYLVKQESTPANYILHAVLVHSGNSHHGHYVVYINPEGDGRWFKFNDDVVSRCSKHEAIELNFGGHEEDGTSLISKRCTNAYMLVYIRESELKNVLQKVTNEDIPQELTSRLKDEKELVRSRLREKIYASIFMEVKVLLEREFQGHQGNDLFDESKVKFIRFKIKKKTTMKELVDIFLEFFNCSLEQMRLWPFGFRSNFTRRPFLLHLESELHRTVFDVAYKDNPWIIFLEQVSFGSGLTCLPDFDKNSNVLIFFKLYDSKNKQIHYCGHYYASISAEAQILIPLLNERAGFPPDTKLNLYREIKPNLIEPIKNVNESLGKVLNKLMNGDIIIFQKSEQLNETSELSDCKKYFEDLYHCVDVTFCNKSVPNDQGFVLSLLKSTTYHQVANAVAQQLNTEPSSIEFCFFPKLDDTSEGYAKTTVKDLLKNAQPEGSAKIFYRILSGSVGEPESKKKLRCLWVNANLEEKKLITVNVKKECLVSDLLNEIKKKVGLSPDGSAQLRMFELQSCKIGPMLRQETDLYFLIKYGASGKLYRVEEIPKDELELAKDEMLVPVAHFEKGMNSTFGVPFFIKIKHGETSSNVKNRIFKKLNILENEFEKFQLAIITSKITFIGNDANFVMNIDELKGCSVKPFLGLEHLEKVPEKSSRKYFEKAVKIYN